jgi:SAM-dependent methyltransferase
MAQSEPPREHDPVGWFADHFDVAAQEVIDFITSDRIELAGATVADVGSGDGIIDLGVALKARPAKLVGYDLKAVDPVALRRSMAAAGIQEQLPGEDVLAFMQSEPDHVPAPNDTFDVVFSWSAFEHISNPVAMLQEIYRILKSDGVFFLQLWPFFNSQHGGHLWLTVDESFAHLTRSPFELDRELKGKPATDPSRPADDEFRSLNRLTLDSLQRALLAAHLRIAKIELIAEAAHIPAELAHLPISELAVSGVKLLAVPF